VSPLAKIVSFLVVVSVLIVGCAPDAINSPSAPTQTRVPPAPTRVQATATFEPTDSPSPDWKIVADDRVGIRYAIPCFWEAQVPEPAQDPSGLGAYTVRNFDDGFVESFGNKGGDLIWENGAMKLDMLIFKRSAWDVPTGSSLEEMAQRALGSDPDTATIDSMDPVRVNGQDGLLVAQSGTYSGEIGHIWLFNLDPELVIGLSPVPGSAYTDPDMRGIVDSLALGPDAAVTIPTFAPAPPPHGVDGSCLSATS
jgi:hypothetical protein